MSYKAENTEKPKVQQSSVVTADGQSKKPGGMSIEDNRPNIIAQRKVVSAISEHTPSHPIIQNKENTTGLPDNLKTGLEHFSGYSMDDVKVHYNSSKPAQLNAHAYAQGTNIHLGTGQEKHLPHEAWHVVQQKQGRVKPTTQLKGGFNINDDTALEKEADTMPSKAMAAANVGSDVGQLRVRVMRQQVLPDSNNESNIVQRKWRETSLNEDFYQWDRVIGGLRWYVHKDSTNMYFMVESPNDQNRNLIKLQGQVKPYHTWLESGLFRALHADNSIVHGKEHERDFKGIEHTEIGPHIFKPVVHRFDEKTGKFEQRTAHYVKMKQGDFEEATGAAASKDAKRKAGDERLALGQPGNVGRFVFHLTTLKNLMFDPKNGNPATGILSIGLDPNKGGGKGGACETCVILEDIEMFEGSKKNSKGVVAVTTSPLNIKMYANQRVEHGEAEFAKGAMSMKDLLLRESILLRFQLTEAHLQAMEIDPQHPKDDTVRLIRGIPIPTADLQGLTSHGWAPLLQIGHSLAEVFHHEIAERHRLFAAAAHIDSLAPRAMHAAWKASGDKIPLKHIVLNSTSMFPNFYHHIFHGQRRGVGHGMAGYAMK